MSTRKRENRRADAGLSIIMACKYLVFTGVVVFAVWLFWSKNMAQASFGEVCAALEESGFMDHMEEAEPEEVQMRLGISGGNCKNFYYTASQSKKDTEELLLVETESDRDSDKVEAALRLHIERQKEKYQSDSARETGVLYQSAIKRRGSYVFYVASENRASFERVFLRSLGRR